MKANIHPTYFENLKIVCACGNIVIAGSTKKELRTELCSACHPFYTGKQKLVDTAGRVDKFMEKVKKMQAMKDKKVKVIGEEEFEEVVKEMDERPVNETESPELAPKKEPVKKEAVAKKAPAPKKAAPKVPAAKKPAAKKAAAKKK